MGPNAQHVDIYGEVLALRICGAVSLFASIIVMATVLHSPNLRLKTYPRLAAYISMSDGLLSMGYLVGLPGANNRTSPTCQFQAVVTYAFMFSSVFWCITINHFVLRIILLNHRNVAETAYHHMLVWGFAILLFLVPLTNPNDGFGGVWSDDGNNTGAQSIPSCYYYDTNKSRWARMQPIFRYYYYMFVSLPLQGDPRKKAEKMSDIVSWKVTQITGIWGDDESSRYVLPK